MVYNSSARKMYSSANPYSSTSGSAASFYSSTERSSSYSTPSSGPLCCGRNPPCAGCPRR